MRQAKWRRAPIVFLAAFCVGCNAIFGLEERQPFPPEAGIGAGGAGGTAGSCPDANVACNGVCVDLATDPANCGGCGKTCNIAGGEVCFDHCTSREWALWPVSELPSYTAGVDTVLDNGTKLTWQRFVPPDSYTQKDAGTYCAGLSVEGEGWRLPTRIEIHSIVDYTKAQPGPMIDTAVFPNAPSADFWSSTESQPGNGWIMASDGRTFTADAMDSHRVRCVR